MPVIYRRGSDGRGSQGRDFREFLNPRSVEIVTAQVEPDWRRQRRSHGSNSSAWLFLRRPDTKPGAPVFNRTVHAERYLAKIEQKSG
jgi:glutaminyl-tRNA synthetase